MIKTIYVIIVNYKSEDIITQAIDSIKEEYLNIKILILDNGSSIKTYKKLCSIQDDRVEVITLKENTGFANGCNTAFLYLKENYNDLSYFFIMNPDAVLERNTIFELYNIIKDRSDIAAISPKIVSMAEEIQYSGSVIDWKNCIINNSNINNTQAKPLHTDVFHGCACLIDAEKFYEAGLFNEKTFMYYDEAFLSMEFKRLSYKILYFPDKIVRHHNSLSIGDYSYLKSYYHTRNHIEFFKKYSKNSNLFRKYKSLCKNCLSFIKHKHLYAFYGMLKGILDSMTHKTGKL